MLIKWNSPILYVRQINVCKEFHSRQLHKFEAKMWSQYESACVHSTSVSSTVRLFSSHFLPSLFFHLK